MKPNLLILFGEYRTFETCIPHLTFLNQFDIIFSTWDFSFHQSFDTHNNSLVTIKKYITEWDITKHIPHCVPIISNHNLSYNYRASKMIYHWKTAVSSIANQSYDKIILHRCDMISTFHTLLDVEFENNILYSEPGQFIDGKTNWYNDYIFAGKSDIIIKFINLFESIKYNDSHLSIANIINSNNIKTEHIKKIHPHYEHYIIKGNYSILLEEMNRHGVKYFKIPIKRRPDLFYNKNI